MYTFLRLDLIGKAQTELEKNKAEITDYSNRQPVLEMTITAASRVRSEQGNYAVPVIVTVQNKGSRDTVIQWTTATPLAAKKVPTESTSTDASSEIIIVKPLSFVRDSGPRSYTLLKGGTARIPFVLAVRRPGLYLLEFQAEVKTLDMVKEVGGGVSRPLVWTDTSFVNVAQ